MSKIGIIGGSGLTTLADVSSTKQNIVDTDFGQPSAPLVSGVFAEKEVVFLTRHGNPHTIPPHRVNYRANIRALKDNNVSKIISINAVGGITAAMKPGTIAIPNQIIDYTWSREHTYFSEELEQVVHIDFTYPYSAFLREIIEQAGCQLEMDLVKDGTYGATQGPRLESAAEIKRMQKDGCDLVGMTGMPEAALARELDIDYVSICLVVNWAAGKSTDIITMEEIQRNLDQGMVSINKLLKETVSIL